MASPMRAIRLCADDYGIAPGVNAAIADLIQHGRINATSVMVVAPSLDAAAVASLVGVAAGRAEIGLHFTLTSPFSPLTQGFKPLKNGAFLPLGRTLASAIGRLLDSRALAAEADAQLREFIDKFGRPPDFVDGHQHVHLFPQIRDAVLAAMKIRAPNAWARQCAYARNAWLGGPKGLLIHLVSSRFRERATRFGVAMNPAFAGAYGFDEAADFSALFPRFLAGLPDRGLIMCHPGFVDDALRRLDRLTDLREREYAYLASERFLADLTAAGVRLL